jgi:hypothetical protein
MTPAGAPEPNEVMTPEKVLEVRDYAATYTNVLPGTSIWCRICDSHELLRAALSEAERQRDIDGLRHLGEKAKWSENTAELRRCADILRQAVEADAIAEWFTDTEHDGIDVQAALRGSGKPV